MKKLMSLLLVLVLSLVLVACGEKTQQEPTKEEEKTQTAEVTEPAEPTKPARPVPVVNYQMDLKPGVPVVTYCTWGFDTEEKFNLTRRLIAKFNYEHDDVQIQIVEPDPGMEYNEFLNTLASVKKLPDVFMVKSLPNAVISKLARDITAFTTADEEWAMLDETLSESASYFDHVYGIPAGQYYQGFFANYTLIDKYLGEDMDYADVEFAPGAFDYQKFIDVTKTMRNVNVKEAGTGSIGINATGDMINWLPSILDKTGNIKHFVWNADLKQFDFKSQAMTDALEIISEVGSKSAQYSFASVENPEEVFGTADDKVAFQAGKIGFLQGATWDSYEDSRGFNVHFVGYPNSRVVSVSDYLCISNSSTTNPVLAYEVAKYLSFGLEGAQARFDIIDAERAVDPKTSLSVNGLPVVTNKEITDRWFEYVSLDGAKEVYEMVVAGEMTLIVEGNKTIPGFQNARFDGDTGLSYENVRGGSVLKIGDYIWDVCSGDISVSTYKSDISDLLVIALNEEVTRAYADIEKVVKK